MNASKEKQLDQLREQFRQGRLEPEAYIKKVLTFKDGCANRQRIMEKAARILGKAYS